MPSWTITYTTNQGARARKVIGQAINKDGAPASNAQISTWLLGQLRAQIMARETGRSDVAEDTIRAELVTEGW